MRWAIKHAGSVASLGDGERVGSWSLCLSGEAALASEVEAECASRGGPCLQRGFLRVWSVTFHRASHTCMHLCLLAWPGWPWLVGAMCILTHAAGTCLQVCTCVPPPEVCDHCPLTTLTVSVVGVILPQVLQVTYQWSLPTSWYRVDSPGESVSVCILGTVKWNMYVTD